MEVSFIPSLIVAMPLIFNTQYIEQKAYFKQDTVNFVNIIFC